ncbi:6,7-dimethyl-8-ribityllumazine synthase [Roseibium alexandrii]|jgi:6,7-dimethyl-8-ribityllumazine synthase|uniref:6,7-dimethyl-8-ribityllumazine synthase n=2 Tax=Roseibium alexandrii TaxID=388408 RepID=A0A0M6ZYL6_9HYPH|nr:6,7-dimethyl-8-ribityllumazine synthase [Roseibium alexandrii]EEE47984.1 6,7-dimethyl-8-ribityllumazine synthase [Roseibium alexandrii DFL-11]CTQ66624.1 6,7-dimethyl-8-ribityllumazine synthase 1 [Roseibium alexandrii]
MSAAPKLLIIEARFYDDLADSLAEGAIATLDAAGATYERVAVPGVLEIPAALSMAMTAMENEGALYDGFVLLGAVIRGETTHYDIVANESNRVIMDLIVDADLAVGNGILTVENNEQAWARAKVGDKNKGGAAAQAALDMIALRERFGV